MTLKPCHRAVGLAAVLLAFWSLLPGCGKPTTKVDSSEPAPLTSRPMPPAKAVDVGKGIPTQPPNARVDCLRLDHPNQVHAIAFSGDSKVWSSRAASPWGSR